MQDKTTIPIFKRIKNINSKYDVTGMKHNNLKTKYLLGIIYACCKETRLLLFFSLALVDQ